MLFLDIDAGAVHRPDLLEKVHRDIRRKLLAGEEELFLWTLRLGRRFKGGLLKHLRAHKCLFSAVFSNLGKVDAGPEAGDVNPLPALTAMQMIPMVRPFSPLNFTVLTFKGCLTLTLGFDSRLVSRAGAEVLLQSLVDKINASL